MCENAKFFFVQSRLDNGGYLQIDDHIHHHLIADLVVCVLYSSTFILSFFSLASLFFVCGEHTARQYTFNILKKSITQIDVNTFYFAIRFIRVFFYSGVCVC